MERADGYFGSFKSVQRGAIAQVGADWTRCKARSVRCVCHWSAKRRRLAERDAPRVARAGGTAFVAAVCWRASVCTFGRSEWLLHLLRAFTPAVEFECDMMQPDPPPRLPHRGRNLQYKTHIPRSTSGARTAVLCASPALVHAGTPRFQSNKRAKTNGL